MRITTWNCCRGQPVEQVRALEEPSSDLVVLQESARPNEEREGLLWVGDSEKQGLAVWAESGVGIRMAEQVESAPTALPAYLDAGSAFQILVVWTLPRPKYPLDAKATLDAYRSFIEAAPTVVLGDFNLNPKFDERNPAFSDSDLLASAKAEFSLVSAYHGYTGEVPGQETRPTYYHQRDEDQPFHIDYCFIPETWSSRVGSVDVATFEAYRGKSDHRPMTVDLTL